jgi:hypothetical protein
MRVAGCSGKITKGDLVEAKEMVKKIREDISRTYASQDD